MAELFHYTSAEGVKGIIESQNLRATHFRFLNDTSELSLLRPRIEKLFRDEIAELVMEDEMRFGSFDSTLRSLFVRDEAKKLFQSAFIALEEMSPLFLTSLCRHTEPNHVSDGLLSQWRSYGKAGGYCIVFDESGFLGQLGEVHDETKYTTFDYRNVRYIDRESDLEFDSLSKIAETNFKREFNRLCSLGTISVPQNARLLYDIDENAPDLGELLQPLLSTLPYQKHSAFAEENEFRIAAAAFTQKMPMPEGVPSPPPFKFRTRGQMLVPYIELFKRDTQLPIKRIIVGPGAMQFERAFGLEAFLTNSRRGNIEVTTSSIPYQE